MLEPKFAPASTEGEKVPERSVEPVIGMAFSVPLEEIVISPEPKMLSPLIVFIFVPDTNVSCLFEIASLRASTKDLLLLTASANSFNVSNVSGAPSINAFIDVLIALSVSFFV